MKIRTTTFSGALVALAIAACASACDNPYEREMGIGREADERERNVPRPEIGGRAAPTEDALIDQRTILENEPLEGSEPTQLSE
ncbi:hypothetical protein [Sandaracinus amylolyticus]|nr:hypothetical protein [Sandaracinus amylolyticus]